MQRRSALSATAFSAFLGLPLLSLAAIWEVQHIQVHAAPGVLLALLYIGIFPTVIGFLSWNAGVRRLGASGAMVFYNTLPLYGALLGIVFLHEPLGLYHLVGGLLIAGGGMWAARSR
jgi:drug/metabolite transporter (DMT)-like permease